MKKIPIVNASIIIPTYNAESQLERCLNSIVKQNYPTEKYEVLILDGGSTDKTLNIASRYLKKINIKIIFNELKDAENGKTKGIELSKGNVVILIDSDNEIINKNWLRLGIDIIEKNKKIFGIHSPWTFNAKDKYINQYFSLLGNSDPLARLLGSKPTIEKKCNKYNLARIKNGIPIIGANGFFWNKSVLIKELKKTGIFEEVNFVSNIVSKGIRRYVILDDDFGVYHYYCNSIFEYLKKRIKVANKFINRKKMHKATWVDKEGYIKLLFAFMYCITVVGPLAESVLNCLYYKKIAWLFHPMICFITAIVYVYSLLRVFLLQSVKRIFL